MEQGHLLRTLMQTIQQLTIGRQEIHKFTGRTANPTAGIRVDVSVPVGVRNMTVERLAVGDERGAFLRVGGVLEPTASEVRVGVVIALFEWQPFHCGLIQQYVGRLDQPHWMPRLRWA